MTLDSSEYDKSMSNAAKSAKALGDSIRNSAMDTETAKNKIAVLSKQYNAAQEKVNKLTAAFNKSVQETGAASKETQKLAKELASAEYEAEAFGKELYGLSKTTKETGDRFSLFSDNLKKGLATAAKVGTAAITAASGAISWLTKNAVQNYAEYEQLVGGVETLFKGSADIVQQYAANAYKTAGLSANEYMETVTSFSSSLLQSLGWDTAQAAVIADMAISDMSDNANKMGTDMASIQNAYQGFAKQNYTMLDNLKLGYGGTKSEMERLIRDAEKLDSTFKVVHTTTKEDNDEIVYSYANIVDAIHIVQTEMGITGTTAKEASETISGSVAAMKSAWSNLVTGFANDNADLDKLIDDVVDSATTAFSNILPAAEKALVGIATAVEKIAPILSEKFPEMAMEILPPLLNAATSLITALESALPSILQVLIDVGPNIINRLIETVVALLPDIFRLGFQVIVSLMHGIAESLDTSIPAFIEGVLELFEFLIEPETTRMLVDLGAHMIAAIAAGLIKTLPVLIEKAPEIIMILAFSLIEAFPIWNEAVLKIFDYLGDTIADLIKAAPQWGRDLIENFVQGIKERIQHFVDTIDRVAQRVRDLLGFSEPKEGPLSNFHTYAPDMMKLFAQGIKDNEHLVKNQIAKSFDFGTTSIGFEASGVWAASRSGQNNSYNDFTGASTASGNPIVLDITLDLDGAVLARKMYRYNKDESYLRGGAFA